ncbi:MAG: NUDIX hydrolase [Candidatus Berkelbacteria bacterium]|nr:NUDIX hydrolase [Candidatus Berkelbacteria bacterium]
MKRPQGSFISNEKNKFIVVRDFDETRFSLPGGSCHLDETDVVCARREVKEETQIELGNIISLGLVKTSVIKDGFMVSKSKYIRNFS